MIIFHGPCDVLVCHDTTGRCPPFDRITAVIRGRRAVTAETAVRLGRYFGTGAALWMNLQTQFDISVVETTKGDVIDGELAGAAPN
ncbi:MAG: HigA family addiction module antidote protein [Pseudomonadales bacterium]|nr:HigA family addiction module antidote protein [Pseudomonadales bacterium]